MIVENKEQFRHFYYIKTGSISLFDDNFTYMYNLEEGSFFGEYNIMFGLLSNMFYKTNSDYTTQ